MPDAESIFHTERFLLAIREDLRHTNSGLRKGFFARLFLKEGALFLAMVEKNPNVTLAELAAMEKLLAAKKEMANPSIERTFKRLRLLPAAHVKR